MAACKSCDAPIRWVVTTKGKRMPLDAAPDDDRGNVVYTSEQPYDDIDQVEVLSTQRLASLPRRHARFTSHFATCPQGRQWRKS